MCFFLPCANQGVDYAIGSHLAELLNRETFNLYASFKRRNIVIYHADEALLKFLCRKLVVYRGTTSVSLLRVSEVCVKGCVIYDLHFHWHSKWVV